MEALSAAIDELVSLDPSRLADSDTIMRLHRELARLDAVVTRAAGAWDAAGEWRVDGARSASSWLAGKCGMPLVSARRRLRLGRALRHLPVAEQAWICGDIESAHVAALHSVRNDRTAELLERDEELLVDDAKTMRFDRFQRSVEYWRQRADPDGADDKGKKQHDDRRFDHSQTFNGAWIGDSLLDPIGGSILDTTLRLIEHELWEADWAEAKDRLGHDPLLHELRRTPKQRRADALVEMATRARVAPKDGRRPEPLFSIKIGFDAFLQVCELWNGTVITPRSLVPWLDQAWIKRVVFNGPSRVIDLGVQRRLFTGADRRVVQGRDDAECFNHLCDAPEQHLQVDHIHEWSDGGPTIQDNGRLACGRCNRRRNKGKRRPSDG